MNSLASTHVSLASQRVDACGRISVRHDGEQTRLAALFQEGAAKMRFPRPLAAQPRAPLEAVLINTAGGLTGGDRVRWQVTIGEGGAMALTTQACEKIYRAAQGEARVAIEIDVDAGGRLAWLPQETILFDRSALSREISIDLQPGAQALVVEAVLFGRMARGETVRSALFHDRWRIRHGGRLVHAEDFRIGPDVAAALAERAVTTGGLAVATVLMVGGDAASHLDRTREIAMSDGCGGASAWQVAGTGKLLARLVAADGYALRKRLQPLVALLNGAAGLPKIWTT